MNQPPTEKTRVRHVPHLADLELLRARHLTQSFPRHTHERYAIGVIEQGALGFYYRGENVVASAGDINLCIPGETHTGQPASAGGWTYRMFYFDAAVLERVASELAGRPQPLPFFASGVIADRSLAQQIRALHIQLEQPGVSLLEQETALLNVLARLVSHYADDTPTVLRPGQEARAVSQVKQYLEHSYASEVSLADLAQLTQLSRYHLLRVFHDSVGVPPHAYLRQVRVRHAKALLITGLPIADVALATGFSDQSHLNRWFKRLWGFTPGEYRNSVQDALG